MKKFDNLTVRELLHIEDGYYKLENPIAYAMDGGGGEISGVISIDTKTNSTDGILKVITTMSDDTSYYVDNIWQDGDALTIAEKDEGSGSGGGEGGGGGVTVVHANKVDEWTWTLDKTFNEIKSLIETQGVVAILYENNSDYQTELENNSVIEFVEAVVYDTSVKEFAVYSFYYKPGNSTKHTHYYFADTKDSYPSYITD